MSTGELAHTLSFYFFGLIAIAAALFAVTSQRILRAAVGLAVTLICSAAFYVLLTYDFIAAIQILVYVGGIVVLIVYAIMLTSSSDMIEATPKAVRRGLAFLATVLFLTFSIAALANTPFVMDTADSIPASVTYALGEMILDTGSSGYVLAFEVISLLLLAAVIGAIVIARSYRMERGKMELKDS